ncbi:fimbria/pilus outer membrane usher protein [Tsuneonella amylolytica]|uniref:fimbrial biogenesis outer membrane usher protein n=1 Tax=Tsuneonella amylolytica TaxID=2338327 RepID=UPI000EA8A774|nr:fimbrial biogenesis outer membrane usher protein [Tsuneonella amylolytica]
MSGGKIAAVLLLGSSALAHSHAALAAEQPELPVAAPSRADVGNRTGRDIVLTVPLKDGATYLGDIPLTIGADQQVRFPADRALQLLSEVLAPQVLDTLRASMLPGSQVGLADFAPAGIEATYNPQTLELVFQIPVERRASRSLAVTAFDRERLGDVLAPLDSSAYLNVRGSFDFVEEGFDTGFDNANLLLDGAVRFGDVVAESDAIWSPGGFGRDFQRLGSRLVYDDIGNLVRWSGGDLETTARGFQSAPDIAGVSIFRSYGVLNPQQIIRPRGDRSFRLDRAATVEVLVNGQQVRRLQLTPGNYDLRDFPFAQGANDIRLNILDDTGRSEILRFNVFLDQTQLAAGLSEFGVYAGVRAPLGPSGPRYSNDPVASGYYRRGISDYVTLGVNAQADEDVQMAGAEAVLASSLGTFGLQGAVSHFDRAGEGYALQATFQRLIQRGNGQSDSLNLFAERRSADFAPVSIFLPTNPYEYEVGGGYSHAFSDRVYAGVDGRYGKGRGNRPDVANFRATAGWRISDLATLNVEGRYVKDSLGEEVSAFASLSVRLGRFSTARAEYDTRGDRARLSYQTLKGSGVGSYNVSADLERSNFGSGVSVNANYFANRAELGFSHYGTFSRNFGRSIGQRSNFRLGTSLAVGGGAVSVGRPIYDSFAIVRPHASLKNASVIVDPTTFGYTAESGRLGAATMPSLSSYSERTVPVEVEGAPAGVDIGQGTYRLFPSYRSGYLLTVGSDYNVTALGTMLDVDGQPVSLVSGTATQLDHPERAAVTVFTNRQGRFGAAGLAPGKWRIEMLDQNKSIYVIDIPADASGVVKLGDINPERN